MEAAPEELAFSQQSTHMHWANIMLRAAKPSPCTPRGACLPAELAGHK